MTKITRRTPPERQSVSPLQEQRRRRDSLILRERQVRMFGGVRTLTDAELAELRAEQYDDDTETALERQRDGL